MNEETRPRYFFKAKPVLSEPKDFRQLIFEALVHLSEVKKDRERAYTRKDRLHVLLNWVVDRGGNFYYYSEPNSIFFWADKNENDFIKLTDNENDFWDDSEKPQKPDDIDDEINHFNMLITDHMTYAPPM